MSSAFLQVQSALAGALTAALPGIPVLVNHTRALGRSEPLAILLRLDSARDDNGPIGVRDWATGFELEVVARAATGTDPAAAADDALQALWAALPALEISGAMDVTADPQIDWTFDAAETPLASALLRLTVRHRTAADTLDPLP
jgi:hypothetical protein